MTAAELYAMDAAEWLAAPVGEDAQPSEPLPPLPGFLGAGAADAFAGRRFGRIVRMSDTITQR